MITFTKKADPNPAPRDNEVNRFEQVRKAAKDIHRQSDTDGAQRRARQKAEDNKLI